MGGAVRRVITSPNATWTHCCGGVYLRRAWNHLEKFNDRIRNLIDELLRLAGEEDLALSDVSRKDIAGQAWETVSSEQTELVVEADTSLTAHERQLQRLFEHFFGRRSNTGTSQLSRSDRSMTMGSSSRTTEQASLPIYRTRCTNRDSHRSRAPGIRSLHREGYRRHSRVVDIDR